VSLRHIVSGGQTGVDRGALDAALAAGVSCGGWCPAGRRAEDGSVPLRYPMRETASSGYAERTGRNVADSDGTLVLMFGIPAGGTALTAQCCKRLQRPLLLIDAASMSAAKAAEQAARFVCERALNVLNVAGPRESEAPGAHRYALATVATLLELCQTDSRREPVSADNVSNGAEHVVPRHR